MKCPNCKKRVMIETDEIFESDSMSVDCPECGYEIEIVIDEGGGCSCSGCGAHNTNVNVNESEENDDDRPLAF